MKKYIIEVLELPYTNGLPESRKLYRAVGFHSLVFDQNGLDKLEPLDDACKNCLDKGDADAAYQQGLDDAWEAARKIVLCTSDGGYLDDELDACFGKERETVYELFRDYTAAEVVEKIREYEEEKKKEAAEIKVGDVVYNQNNYRDAIVLKVRDDGNALVMESSKSGIMFHTPPLRALSKKNRHVDLSELFGGEKESEGDR